MTEAPILWHPEVPGLQLSWDATSLRALMQCSRAYYYSIVKGYRSDRDIMRIENGSIYHVGWEAIENALVLGAAPDDALITGCRAVLSATWTETEIHFCPACDFELPGVHSDFTDCPRCRAPLDSVRVEKRAVAWEGDQKAYSRESALRALIWSFDSLWEKRMTPPKLEGGKAPIEMSFAFPFHTTSHNEFWLCGNIDSTRDWNGTIYPAERKTTGSSLSEWYFSTFQPNVQIGVYDIAGQVLWPDVAGPGVVLEATQFAVSFARSERRLILGSEDRRDEYINEISLAIDRAEVYAEEQHWPMNFASCPMCKFKDVCKLAPHKREMALKNLFYVYKWDPLNKGLNSE